MKRNRLILLPLAAAAAVFLMPPLRAQQSVPAGSCRIDGKAVERGDADSRRGRRHQIGRDRRRRHRRYIDRHRRHVPPHREAGHVPDHRGADRIHAGVARGDAGRRRAAARPSTSRSCSHRARRDPSRRSRRRAGARRPVDSASRRLRCRSSRQPRRWPRARPIARRRKRRRGSCCRPASRPKGRPQSLAVSGNMANLDRGMMGERLEAIGPRRVRSGHRRARAGLRPPGARAARRIGPGGPGRTWRTGRTRRSRRVRRARRARRRSGRRPRRLHDRRPRRPPERLQRPGNYTFGGSALDSDPYQLRPDCAGRASRPTPPELRRHRRRAGHAFPASTTARAARTSRSPTTATAATSCSISTPPCRPTRCAAATSRRCGVTLVDPRTGQPFAGNQIPAGAAEPASRGAAPLHPAAQPDGRQPQLHYTTTTDSVGDNVNLASPTTSRRRRGRARRRRRTRRRRAARGGAGRTRRRGAQQGTTVVMNAQVQYRRNDNEQINVFPTLGGTQQRLEPRRCRSRSTSRGAARMHNVNVNFSRTTSTAR